MWCFFNISLKHWLVLTLAAFLLLALASCTATDQEKFAKAIISKDPEKAFKDYAKTKSVQYKKSPEIIVRDLEQLDVTFKKLSAIVESIWGKKNAEMASKKKYVKYTNQYKSKALVDFEQGLIKVETIDSKQPLSMLKQAIVLTLLTPENPADTDIFSDKSPVIKGKPYLLDQVLDQENKPIAYEWRAKRFADYLIKTALKKERLKRGTMHYVEIDMVNQHNKLRKNKYASYVLAAANRYQIKPELIYAIIETESSFNPFAVSHANAYGLMQIIPSTAGKDVYQRILKKPGMPSKKTLFTAEDNIHIGTAYLQILQRQYLNKIEQAQSRHYSIISAYNGGAGNVFKTFSRDRTRAPHVINKLSPAEVYQKLTNQHPKAESRRYLVKVLSAEKKYR